MKIKKGMRFKDKDDRIQGGNRVVKVIAQGQAYDRWVCENEKTGRKSTIQTHILQKRFELLP